jgi:proline iminopeptidase
MAGLIQRNRRVSAHSAQRATAITVAAVLLSALGSAGAASAPDHLTSFRARGPGDVSVSAWVTRARPGAPTLIVINGGPGGSHAAAPPAGVLAPQFRVVFYDQRGTGRSSTPRDGGFDLAHQVGDLEALRRRLGAAQIDLLGHSWGGLIAAAYAARYPHRVNRMVLAGALPADPDARAHGDALIAAQVTALISRGVIRTPLPPVIQNDCTARTNALAVASLADPRHKPPHLPPGTCNQATETQTSAAITATILDAVRAHLRRYRGHALILFGKQDPRLPAFLPADRHEVPNAHVKAIVLQHAGHDTWVENRQFFPIIQRFLTP